MPNPPPYRYAPEIPLPPYAYVPGHGLPHPGNDPGGHSFGQAPWPVPPRPDVLTRIPTEPAQRRRAFAALLVPDPGWRFALDLFNEGFCWEAHEAWEHVWIALGRTTPEARFVQGLIHLAAAAVKIREGKPAGVAKHTQRARELLGESALTEPAEAGMHDEFGLDPASIHAVLADLDGYRPECWHTSRTPVVKVLSARLGIAEQGFAGER